MIWTWHTKLINIYLIYELHNIDYIKWKFTFVHINFKEKHKTKTSSLDDTLLPKVMRLTICNVYHHINIKLGQAHKMIHYYKN